MAGYRTHIAVSGGLGVVYGGAAVEPLGFTTETGILAAGLTMVGGMLPDLDSSSGVPVREMFGLAAVVVPLTLIPRLHDMHVSQEGILATLLFGYVVIRYGVSRVFKRFTVHRGMFHSLPAMVIAGLIVYLGYNTPYRPVRFLFAAGVMTGFLSHLILDELYSVDFRGLRIHLNQFAGSALKFVSSSFIATTFCYLLLGSLLYLAYLDYQSAGFPDSSRESAAARGSTPARPVPGHAPIDW